MAAPKIATQTPNTAAAIGKGEQHAAQHVVRTVGTRPGIFTRTLGFFDSKLNSIMMVAFITAPIAWLAGNVGRIPGLRNISSVQNFSEKAADLLRKPNEVLYGAAEVEATAHRAARAAVAPVTVAGAKHAVSGGMNKLASRFSSPSLASAAVSVKEVESRVAQTINHAVTSASTKTAEVVGNSRVMNYGLGKKAHGAISRLPGTLKNMKTGDALFAATLATGSVLQGASMAKTAREQVAVLKQMNMDFGGGKASTLKIMFGHVQPEVQAARREVLKQLAPSAVLQLAGLFAQGLFIRSSGGGKGMGRKTMFAAMALQMAPMAAGVFGTKNFTPQYGALSDALKAGQATAADYAQFIGVASKEAASAGGQESILVQQLAVFYAEQKATAATIMKHIASGQLNTIAETLKAGGKPADLPAQTQVVGEHTAKIAQQRGMSTTGKVAVAAGALAATAYLGSKTQAGQNAAKAVRGAFSNKVINPIASAIPAGRGA